MLDLHCCPERCSDVERVTINQHRTIYPHTCVWNCTKFNNKRCRQRRSHDDDAFFKCFHTLPHEMKLHALSFCGGFHLLANTELWLRDVDPLHYSRIMRDHHITTEHRTTCREKHMFDLNRRSHGCVYIGITDTYRMHARPNEDHLVLDKCFGSFNRYPSAYYRRCLHFDGRTERSNDFTQEEIADRWRRFQQHVIEKALPPRETGRSALATTEVPRPRGVRSIDEGGIQALLSEAWTLQKAELKPEDDSYLVFWSGSHDVPILHHEVKLDLEPGLYYWEFINYNWEGEMAAIEGDDRSRQRHFFLDPSDSSHTFAEADGRRRIYMSIMYRRVCHPDAEKDDRYTNIAYFKRSPPPPPPQPRLSENGTKVYFTFGTSSMIDDEDGGDDIPTSGACNCPEEHQEWTWTWDDNDIHCFDHSLVYKHVLTPDSFIEVFRERKRKGKRNISHYCVKIPGDITMHSLDRNRNTIRLNLFIEMEKMFLTDSDAARAFVAATKAFYGNSIVKAVNSNVDGGYGFTPDKDIGLYAGDCRIIEKTTRVFDFFYAPRTL